MQDVIVHHRLEVQYSLHQMQIYLDRFVSGEVIALEEIRQLLDKTTNHVVELQMLTSVRLDAQKSVTP